MRKLKMGNTGKIKKTAAGDNTRAYPIIMSYINSLPDYSPQAKQSLADWYTIHGKGKVSLGQLKGKLSVIEKDCDKDMELLTQAFDNATAKGWYAFYKPKSYNQSGNVNTVTFTQPTIPESTPVVDFISTPQTTETVVNNKEITQQDIEKFEREYPGELEKYWWVSKEEVIKTFHSPHFANVIF